jgi:hypothetical protein
MCVHGPGDEDEESDYGEYYDRGADQEHGSVHVTIRPPSRVRRLLNSTGRSLRASEDTTLRRLGR